MKRCDVEALLAVDRRTPLTQVSEEAKVYQAVEAPDPRYTTAAVRRRLGEQPGSREEAWSSEWALVVASIGSFGVMVTMVLTHWDASPWWLLAVPAFVLPVLSVLIYKGAKTDGR